MDMLKKWPVLCGLAGLGVYVVHAILEYLFGGLPDGVNALMMMISVVLMFIGIAYSGMALGRAFQGKQ